MKMALWGGRFKDKIDEDMAEFNNSLKFDKRMYKEDIFGSQVYAEALEKVNLITGDFYYLNDNLRICKIHYFYRCETR